MLTSCKTGFSTILSITRSMTTGGFGLFGAPGGRPGVLISALDFALELFAFGMISFGSVTASGGSTGSSAAASGVAGGSVDEPAVEISSGTSVGSSLGSTSTSLVYHYIFNFL